MRCQLLVGYFLNKRFDSDILQGNESADALTLLDSIGGQVSGAYNRYGGRCTFGDIRCDRIIVRTKMGVNCSGPGGDCGQMQSGQMEKKIDNLAIFYAIYIRQGNGDRFFWTPAFMGVTEPAIIACADGQMLTGIGTTDDGRPESIVRHGETLLQTIPLVQLLKARLVGTQGRWGQKVRKVPTEPDYKI